MSTIFANFFEKFFKKIENIFYAIKNAVFCARYSENFGVVRSDRT